MKRLSPVQTIIINLAEAGLTNPEIADHLGVTPSTVAQHIYRVRRKLGVPLNRNAVQMLGAEVSLAEFYGGFTFREY